MSESLEREQAWLKYQCGFCKGGAGPSATIGLIGRKPFKYICLTCIGMRVLGEEFFQWVHGLRIIHGNQDGLTVTAHHVSASSVGPKISRPKDRSLWARDGIKGNPEKQESRIISASTSPALKS